MHRIVCAAILAAAAAASVRAATYPAYVPQGLSSLPQGTLLYGRDNMSGFATGAVQTVSGQPFTSALRVTVAQPSANPWDINIRVSVPQAVAAGDVLLMVFWARALQGQPETSQGWVGALFEKSSADWNKSFAGDVAPGPEWKQYVFPFACDAAYGAGGTHWGFNFGAIAQVVEIGGLELIYFGTSVTLAQLEPFRTRITYPGIEPDAPWRAAAAARIEQIRKAGLSLTVLNNGVPAADAVVRIEMVRHAFGFGTAVNAGLISGGAETTYMRKIRENFNKAVIENDLKWRYWSSATETRSRTAITWLAGQHIDVRGHVLVWPSWRNMPDSASRDSATLARQILSHIGYAVNMFRGTLAEWDVINEPYDNHDAMDLLGNHAMVDWFAAAHAADPAAQLYINDYSILAGNDSLHRQHYYNTIRYLLDNGAALQGIGMQGHFGQSPTAPAEVLRRLDRFAALGLPIQVTEFDVNTTDEELQAAYTRDFLTTVFSHPAVHGFLMWGFWEGAHWLPDAAMYRRDWSEKLNLHAYRSLVFDAWWTRDTLATDAAGGCGTRGFKGEYRVSVTIGGVTKELGVSLTRDSDIVYDFATGQVLARQPGHTRASGERMGLHLLSGRRRCPAAQVSGPAGQQWTLLVTDSAGRTVLRCQGRGPSTVDLAQSGRLARGAYLARLAWEQGAVSAALVVGR